MLMSKKLGDNYRLPKCLQAHEAISTIKVSSKPTTAAESNRNAAPGLKSQFPEINIHLKIKFFDFFSVQCNTPYYIVHATYCRVGAVGSPTNHLGSRQRRDTGQGSFSLLTGGLDLTKLT